MQPTTSMAQEVANEGAGMVEAARRSGGQYLYVPEAGHIVHASAPWVYRGAVEAFLSTSISPV